MQTTKKMNGVVVITGGAGGMGLATAKIVGKEKLVVICDVDQDRLSAAKTELNKSGILCETFVCDIADAASVKRLVHFCQSNGKVTAVIHTAGISPSMGDPKRIIQINAIGTININQAFYRLANEGFAMVNVSSMAGYQLPAILAPKSAYKYAFSDIDKLLSKLLFRAKLMPKKLRPGMAYAISKHFVIWYSQALADEYGEKGARILSVSPGSFDTAMGKLEADHGASSMADISALRRFGTPEEIAELLAFCASEKAGYLTGTDILCDGGTVAAMKIHDKKPDIKL